jgi:hypothetical protein
MGVRIGVGQQIADDSGIQLGGSGQADAFPVTGTRLDAGQYTPLQINGKGRCFCATNINAYQDHLVAFVEIHDVLQFLAMHITFEVGDKQIHHAPKSFGGSIRNVRRNPDIGRIPQWVIDG